MLPAVALLAASGLTGCGSSSPVDPKPASTGPTLKRMGQKSDQSGGPSNPAPPKPKTTVETN